MGTDKEHPWYNVFVLWSLSASDTPHFHSVLVRYHLIRPYFGLFLIICLQRTYFCSEISGNHSSRSRAHQGAATRYSARSFHAIANPLHLSKPVRTRGLVVGTQGARKRDGRVEVGGSRGCVHRTGVEGVSREARETI